MFSSAGRFPLAGLLVLLKCAALGANEPTFAQTVQPFLKAHCIKCHGPDQQAGEVRLDELTAERKHTHTWGLIRAQLRDGYMPPRREPPPDAAQTRAVIAWTTALIASRPGRLPNHGNLLPHELLFGGPALTAGFGPARVWRLHPNAYQYLVRDVFKERLTGLSAPFTLQGERGIRDFADLYSLDEASTEILIRNAALIVEAQTSTENKNGQTVGRNGAVREFLDLLAPSAPTPRQLETAIQTQFRKAVARPATADEVRRYVGLYDKGVPTGDRVGAARTMLQVILLRADALYRYELGTGPADTTGRRWLSPVELEMAVNLSLGHQRHPALVPTLVAAQQQGVAAVRAAIAERVRAVLTGNKSDKERIYGFFREYFAYHHATEVFKDKPARWSYAPTQLVADTDRLMQQIVNSDRDVFRELLLTTKSFVNAIYKDENKPGRVPVLMPAVKPISFRPEKGDKPAVQFETWYGLEQFPEVQPVELPAEQRLGILMQPSWLIAWSTNFETDPVRRGRWIRERLLGGTVPDLPIGVAAMVSDDHEQPFRTRLQVTRSGRCWKCHQKMDDLGLPFEQFDHFGRYRTTEAVVDAAATAKNVDKKGKALGPVLRQVPLDTTGTITDSGDARLDGPVRDPRELIRKIAATDRARQVFVRHAFRYFLGRNESLADAKTLQDADRAYVQAGGSFRALVQALLTSDSFLYRVAPVEDQP
jgi:hypothetical protein